MEEDYIKIITEKYLIFCDGVVLINPTKRDSNDSKVIGYKSLLKENQFQTKEMLRAIIKNTYRTLMTRGMKGCYIYYGDKETNNY